MSISFRNPHYFTDLEGALDPLKRAMHEAYKHDTVDGKDTFLARVYRVSEPGDLTGKYTGNESAIIQDGEKDIEEIEVYAYPVDDELNGYPGYPSDYNDQYAIFNLPVFKVPKNVERPIAGSFIKVRFNNLNDMAGGGTCVSLVAKGNGFPKASKKSDGQLAKKASGGASTFINNPSNLTLGFS